MGERKVGFDFNEYVADTVAGNDARRDQFRSMQEVTTEAYEGHVNGAAAYRERQRAEALRVLGITEEDIGPLDSRHS